MNRDFQWTREQVLLGINLYYKLPIGNDLREQTSLNTFSSYVQAPLNRVIQLMVRLQTLDPDASNPEGAPTDLEKEAWNTFHDSLELWTALTQRIFKQLDPTELSNGHIEETLPGMFAEERERLQEEELDRVRSGQSFLLDVLLAHYGERCAVCGLNRQPYLSLAHVIPWESIDDPDQRVDPRNAILFCSLHRTAFEQNDLQIDPNSYTVLIVDNAETEERLSRGWQQLRYYHGNKLTMPQRFPPKKEHLRRRLQVPDEASRMR